MVMLHGLRAYARTWDKLALIFQDRFRMLALDQRGRGETQWDPEANYYTDAYLADLEAFVDALDLERFILIGHSMGGTTAYVYTARHAERIDRAVIEDIGPGSAVQGAGSERIKREMTETPAAFDNWDRARAYWRGLRPRAGDDAIEQRVRETLREGADGNVVWRFDWAGIRKTRLEPDRARIVDLWPIVDSIERPVLVLRGARSDFLPVETCQAMAERNTWITWREIPDASHYAHDDNLEAYAAELSAFLSDPP
jgi:pimeloyl-ACP methyl ester carboxylesterase